MSDLIEHIKKAKDIDAASVKRNDMYNDLGKIYTDGGDHYFLAQVSYGIFALIGIQSGNRLNEPSENRGEVFHNFDGSPLLEVKNHHLVVRRKKRVPA